MLCLQSIHNFGKDYTIKQIPKPLVGNPNMISIIEIIACQTDE